MFLTCEKYHETNQRLFPATAVNGQPHASRHYILIPPKMAAAYHNVVDTGCCTTVSCILDEQNSTLTSSILVREWLLDILTYIYL